MARGRPPSPQKLVEPLEGSELAKRRLQLILQTAGNQCTVAEACVQLGIEESAFHKMRKAALQRFVDQLEPQPRGRPPRNDPPDDPRLGSLEEENQQLKMMLLGLQTRLDLSLAMPHLLHKPTEPTPSSEAGAVKKTTYRGRRTGRRRRR